MDNFLASRELTFQNFAVGIFASYINFFAQDLPYSNFAPSLPGPNTLKSFSRRKLIHLPKEFLARLQLNLFSKNKAFRPIHFYL